MLAAQAPVNFTHRVHLIEGASALADGDTTAALDHLRLALDGAIAHQWFADIGLAHELAARCHEARADLAATRLARLAATEAYALWGAQAKVAALTP